MSLKLQGGSVFSIVDLPGKKTGGDEANLPR
jgi:hypothetical protein